MYCIPLDSPPCMSQDVHIKKKIDYIIISEEGLPAFQKYLLYYMCLITSKYGKVQGSPQ